MPACTLLLRRFNREATQANSPRVAAAARWTQRPQWVTGVRPHGCHVLRRLAGLAAATPRRSCSPVSRPGRSTVLTSSTEWEPDSCSLTWRGGDGDERCTAVLVRLGCQMADFQQMGRSQSGVGSAHRWARQQREQRARREREQPATSAPQTTRWRSLPDCGSEQPQRPVATTARRSSAQHPRGLRRCPGPRTSICVWIPGRRPSGEVGSMSLVTTAAGWGWGRGARGW